MEIDGDVTAAPLTRLGKKTDIYVIDYCDVTVEFSLDTETE